MMVVMVASTYLPKPWDMVAVFGTYAALFGYMFLSQLVLQYMLAKNPALDAVIVGYNPDGTGVVRQTLLIEDYKTTGTPDGTYMTQVRLAHVFKDPEGGQDTGHLHIPSWRLQPEAGLQTRTDKVVRHDREPSAGGACHACT
jgi:hypothetical protein